MFKVANYHSVTLARQVFKSGARLPANRDYSTLIDLGVVIEVPEQKPAFPTNEPSIVKITRDKVKRAKTEQAKAKKNRAVVKKKASAKKKPAKKKKTFTVETGG